MRRYVCRALYAGAGILLGAAAIPWLMAGGTAGLFGVIGELTGIALIVYPRGGSLALWGLGSVMFCVTFMELAGPHLVPLDMDSAALLEGLWVYPVVSVVLSIGVLALRSMNPTSPGDAIHYRPG